LDSSAIESIRFAIDHLNCDSIVVLCHECCGAVTAMWDKKSALCSSRKDHYYDENDCKHTLSNNNIGSTTSTAPLSSYPKIEKYVGKSLCMDKNLSREQNIENSIKKNAIRTAKLIVKNTGIDSHRVHPSYYNIKSGQVDLL
jgi:carbonic anhydrase